MPVIDILGSRKEAEVMEDTWGHLRPDTTRTYTGWVLIASPYFAADSRTVVDLDFGDLADSPWFFDGLHAMIDRLDLAKEPGLWRWEGTYRHEANRRVWIDEPWEDGTPDGYWDDLPDTHDFDGSVARIPHSSRGVA